MRARTPLVLGIGAILIGALLSWFWATRSGHEAQAMLAGLAEERIGLEASVRRTEANLSTAERTGADLQRELDALDPAKVAAASTRTASASPPKSQRELISTDPKLEALSLRWSRAVVELEYGPLFRALGLSSEQIKKFEENYVNYNERDMDLGAVARMQDAGGKQTVADLQKKAKEEFEAAQATVLGRDGYQQLQEYLRTLVARNVIVLGLAGAAALEGVPLTARQGDQLWQAAVKAAGSDPKAKGEQMVRAIDWDVLDAEARQILTPAQYTLYSSVAAPAGFGSRWKYQLDAVVLRAKQADAAGLAVPVSKTPGS